MVDSPYQVVSRISSINSMYTLKVQFLPKNSSGRDRDDPWIIRIPDPLPMGKPFRRLRLPGYDHMYIYIYHGNPQPSFWGL